MRRFPDRFRPRLRRALTVPNVLSTLALLAALCGATITAAWAAPMLTGANVKNGSLQSRDVKNGNLAALDFSATARTALKAQTGPKGDAGQPGSTGPKGRKGAKGADGPDAGRAYSYITADDTSSYLKPKSTNFINPDPTNGICNFAPNQLPAFLGLPNDCSGFSPYFPHWSYDCNAFLPKYCGLGDRVGSAGSGATQLGTGSNGVVGFTGDENGSFVTLMGPGNILVTASLTLMHPKNDNFHSRVSCQPQVRRSNSSDQYSDLGVPTMVSGRDVLELVHITVTGGARFEQAGDYDFQVACRLVDEYNTGSADDNWYFISGNATATTTEL